VTSYFVYQRQHELNKVWKPRIAHYYYRLYQQQQQQQQLMFDEHSSPQAEDDNNIAIAASPTQQSVITNASTAAAQNKHHNSQVNSPANIALRNLAIAMLKLDICLMCIITAVFGFFSVYLHYVVIALWCCLLVASIAMYFIIAKQVR